MQAAESEQCIGSDFIAEENLHFEENNDDDENSSYDEDTGDDSDEMSEYEESISFHNACREFYMNRKDGRSPSNTTWKEITRNEQKWRGGRRRRPLMTPWSDYDVKW